MGRPKEPKPHKRDGTWYLIRRVPKEFAELDRRVLVRISTNIAVADDPRAVRAKAIVHQLNRELEAYWLGMHGGKSAEAELRYNSAKTRARSLGLAYQTADELAAGPLDEILRRVQLLADNNALEKDSEVAAVLGGEPHLKLKVSDLPDAIEAHHSTDLTSMSPDQRKRWRAAKDRAAAYFISVVGDKVLLDLTRKDALTYRRWWQDRIATQGLEINTANKEIGHISKMLSTIETVHEMGIQPIFRMLSLAGETSGQRQAFSVEHVQEVILANGALDGLNEEARRVVYVMADTGLRLSEVCNLLPETVHVDAPVPYVEILPIGRQLKTRHSTRQIPLVGTALAAMKEQQNGFPRYLDKGPSLSAVINKFLRTNGMLAQDKQTVYSLRHTFEDRLTAVEAPEKVVAMLMGHKWNRPRYGDGPTLEQKQRWLAKIAFKPPSHV